MPAIEKSILKNIYSTLERNKLNIPLFLCVFFLDLVFHLTLSWFVNLYDPKILEIFDENYTLTEIFILSVIIGPIIESFLFQYLIIEILYIFKIIKVEIILIISALAFSLSHYYNFIYILITFISGLIYASYYIYLKIEKKKFPFLYILALHSLYNFTVFILNDILGW